MNYTINYLNDSKKTELKDVKLTIDFEEFNDFERSELKNEYSKICIREHRRYTFENELEINFNTLDLDFTGYTEEELAEDYDYQNYKEEQKKLQDIQEKYYLFDLDFFDHSCIGFSLSCNRIDLWYYNMDRTCNVGFIAIEKSSCKDYEEAKKLAAEEIENYTNYCNGWIYSYSIEEGEDYFNKDLSKNIYSYDLYDSCGWFLKKDYAEEYAKEVLASYLNQKWIEYDSIELIEN